MSITGPLRLNLSARGTSAGAQPTQANPMENESEMTPPKTQAYARRQILIGFNHAKSADGSPVGSDLVRLNHRNAYEAMGLRRPPRSPRPFTPKFA